MDPNRGLTLSVQSMDDKPTAIKRRNMEISSPKDISQKNAMNKEYKVMSNLF